MAKTASKTASKKKATPRKSTASKPTGSDALAQQIVAAMRAPTTQATPVVGIRSISYETVALPPSPVPGEAAITLHANFGDADPNTVAIVSLPWWLQLRKSRIYAMGHFKRDDSILGPQHVAAPEDRPEDCAPEHAANAIDDADAFFADCTESEIRTRVSRITSESTLRKLQTAIDRRVVAEQDKYPETDPERAEKAVKDLPALYAKAESLVEDRLYAIRPRIDI